MISRTKGDARRRRETKRVPLGVILLVIGLIAPVDPVAAADVAVAVNPVTQVIAGDLSRNALRAIFGMRLRIWPDGSEIRVYVLPDDHPLHVQFCKEILGVFPHQLRAAWDRLVYSGTGQAPLQVESEDAMRTEIARNAGAVGYLTREVVPPAAAPPRPSR